MVRRERGHTPPILTLLDLYDEYRGAFEYDWRTRFGVAASKIGSRKMPWGEAWRLLEILLDDSTSVIASKVGGWDRPMDRAALVLMDLYDMQHQAAVGQAGSKRKVKPYPRPWPNRSKTITRPAPEITQEQVIAALRFAGHTAALPVA